MRRYIESKFLLLLITLILLIFISPYMAVYHLGNWTISLFLLLVLLSQVFILHKKRIYFIYACALGAVIMILSVYNSFHPSVTLIVIERCLELVFFIFAIVTVFIKVFKHKRITPNTIYAALCVYLLIGLAYTYAYLIVEIVNPGSFLYNEAALVGETLGFNLSYFSFTTLTTVGFGDIVPVTIQAKSIVIVEEITGVLYLAAIVSRLIAGMSVK